MRKGYLHNWIRDFWEIFMHEMRLIFRDEGVLVIFFLAGLAYPLLYNVIYLNGIVEETPIAVVDNADCAESRDFIRQVDATRECKVAYHCVNMEEAEALMQERKAHGILYFDSEYGRKLAHNETAVISLYADMCSFLYFKNDLIATNQVMLHKLEDIQVNRYMESGLTKREAEAFVKAIPYEENNPYNNAFSYSIFLISAILFVIIQQTMFYGMSLLVGTMREENRSFAMLPDSLSGLGVGRVILGRGLAYWLIYMFIGIYIATIVPEIFGIPQRGDFWEVLLLLLFFVTDCVVFCFAWSTFITRRESVFLLFLFISPVCLFLTGFSWPVTAFPQFWKYFSYLFPTTFGCQGFININTAGGGLASAEIQFLAMTVQIIVYYCFACLAIYVENWILKHQEELKAVRLRLAEKVGFNPEEDAIIITGQKPTEDESEQDETF